MRGKVHGRPGNHVAIFELEPVGWAGGQRQRDGKEGSRDGWMGQQRHHRRRSRDILPSLLSGRHSLALTHAHAHNTHTHSHACVSFPPSFPLSLSLFSSSSSKNLASYGIVIVAAAAAATLLAAAPSVCGEGRTIPSPLVSLLFLPFLPSKRALFIISFQGARAHDGHAPAPRACVRLPARPASGVHLAMWATRCDILESDIVPGFAAICHHAAAAADHDDAANVL